MKNKIREYALSLGVNDVGFANIADYDSPRTPDLKALFPEVKSLVVCVLREGSHIESLSPQIAMSGRMDIMEFGRSINFKLAGFLELQCGARAMAVPLSYPLDMGVGKMGLISDVSLRHAAVAAGLGTFGRNNLVLHPRFGSRVIFTAVLCDLDLPSDPPCTEDICNQCGICVEMCPSGALENEGITNELKCLKVSQPYGIGKTISFWRDFVKKSPEEQKKMFISEEFMKIYQSQMIGFQYFCFKCYNSCPLNN